MVETESIAVVGSGYVGTVVASCLASLGRDVIGVEIDEERLATLRQGEAPFFEPGLNELIAAGIDSGALSFTDDFEDALERASILFLCVGTPAQASGEPDLSALEAAGRAIGAALKGGEVIVTKSTVPIGNGHWLSDIIAEAAPSPTPEFSIVSNPEFLREGRAINDFLHPDRVVVGGEDDAAVSRVAGVYRPILEQSFEGARADHEPELVRTDLATAETIKYASNALLATKISFINEIATICEPSGADVTEVARAIGLDSRISPEFLTAGIGWGGSCFGKDLAGLTAAAESHGLKPKILQAVREVNQQQRRLVIEKLHRHLGELDGRRIAVLGLAFKDGTDDVRDSPAVDIVRQLIEIGSVVTAHDPIVESVSSLPDLATTNDPYVAAKDAEAIVLATEWPEFRDLDFGRLAAAMEGALLIDGRNLLDPEQVVAAGLTYDAIGRRTIGPDGER